MTEIKLYRSPPGAGLEEVVEAFVRSYQAHPFSTHLVLPDGAVRDAIKLSVAGRGIPVFGAAVCTLNELAEHFFGSLNRSDIRLDGYAVELILYKVLEENRQRLPLFDGPAGTVRAMVPEVRAFLEALSDYQADYPGVLGGLRSDRSEQLGRIRDLYAEFLGTNNLADRGAVFRWTIAELGKNESVKVRRVIFYGLYEPKPLEKAFIRSVAGIAERADYHVPFIEGSKAFADDGSWLQAGETIGSGEGGGLLPAALYSSGPKRRLDNIVKGAFRDPLEEMRAVAREVRSLIGSGVAPGRIAVVLPVRSKAAPLVREVFEDHGIPFSLYLGTPLSESPLVMSIFSILDAVCSGYGRDAVVRLAGSPFFTFKFDLDGKRTFLRGREVDRVGREAQVIGGREGWSAALSALAAKVRDEMALCEGPAEEDPRKRELERIGRVARGLEWLFSELSALEGGLTVPQRADALRGLLRRFGTAGRIEKEDGTGREREVRALGAFLSALEAMEMGDHIAPSGPMLPEEFTAKLRMLASAEGFHGSPDDRNAVQVSGLRATYLMRYDHLFVVGLVDGDIPYLAAGNPFLREREAARMGLLRRDDLLRQERFYFLAALLSSDRRTYVSRAGSDNDSILVPSIFWDHLEAAFDMDTFGEGAGETSALCCQRTVGEMLSRRRGIGSVSVDLPVPVEEVRRRISVERDERTGGYRSPYDAVFSGEAARAKLSEMSAGKDVHSPSRLESYARCPFGYYLRYVLRIEPPVEVESDLDPAGRGALFHRIAFRFYSERREAGETRVAPERLGELAERIERIGREELERYRFDGPAWEAYKAAMLGSAERKGLLRAFLEKEAAGVPGLAPKFFELSFGLPLKDGEADPASKAEPVEIDLGPERLRLGCRIDRVDAAEDGRFVVLDYKTGAKAPSAAAIDKGLALQLPLYIQAVEAALEGMKGMGGAYYVVRSEADIKHEGVFADGGHRDLLEPYFGARRSYREDLAGAIAASNSFILSYLEGMRSGRFHPTLEPTRNCPRRCDYAMICRSRSDRGGEGDADR